MLDPVEVVQAREADDAELALLRRSLAVAQAANNAFLRGLTGMRSAVEQKGAPDAATLLAAIDATVFAAGQAARQASEGNDVEWRGMFGGRS